jgi:hypothetical protein
MPVLCSSRRTNKAVCFVRLCSAHARTALRRSLPDAPAADVAGPYQPASRQGDTQDLRATSFVRIVRGPHHDDTCAGHAPEAPQIRQRHDGTPSAIAVAPPTISVDALLDQLS